MDFKWDNESVEELKKLRHEGHTWEELSAIFDLSANALRKAYYRYLDNRDSKQKPTTKAIQFDHEKNQKEELQMMENLDTRRILCISDQHAPYQHPDMFEFLKAIKQKYKPTLVINGGDEVDAHSLSFHDSDSDLPSAGDELKKATKVLKDLEKLFPEMIILDSNHGSMAVRKFKHHGIPLKFLATPQQLYGVSNKWKWVPCLTVNLPNGQECFFSHGMVKSGIKLAQQRGTNVVQFHFHTDFRIDYVGNPHNLLFSLQSGCLIDTKALAFAYDKLNLNRPIIGTSVIIDSKPVLIPMVLDKNGRWNKKL